MSARAGHPGLQIRLWTTALAGATECDNPRPGGQSVPSRRCARHASPQSSCNIPRRDQDRALSAGRNQRVEARRPARGERGVLPARNDLERRAQPEGLSPRMEMPCVTSRAPRRSFPVPTSSSRYPARNRASTLRKTCAPRALCSRRSGEPKIGIATKEEVIAALPVYARDPAETFPEWKMTFGLAPTPLSLWYASRVSAPVCCLASRRRHKSISPHPATVFTRS